MRTRRLIGWCLAGSLAGAAWLGFRQRELSRLHADNDALRLRIAAAMVAVAPPIALSNSAPSPLSHAERLELMRLRGEVGTMREDLRVHRPDPPVVGQRAPVGSGKTRAPDPKLNQAVQDFLAGPERQETLWLAEALSGYLKDRDGMAPGDFGTLKKSDGTPLPGSIVGRFEVMVANRIPDGARSHTLVAREKRPRSTGDGQWFRVYIYADEALAISGPVAEPDWPKWEQTHQAFRKQVADEKATGANQR